MYNKTTVPPSIEVTEQPYHIVNNPDDTVVRVPIDITTPTAQTSTMRNKNHGITKGIK
jgi:hypothetical protein